MHDANAIGTPKQIGDMELASGVDQTRIRQDALARWDCGCGLNHCGSIPVCPQCDSPRMITVAVPRHFDARPGTLMLGNIVKGRAVLPDEHNPAVPAQSAKSYEDLMRENMKLRAGIREVEGRIARMLTELDITISRLTKAGGGK